MNPIITGIIIGVVTPTIVGIGALAIKMIRRHRKRAEILRNFDPDRCILHGDKIDVLTTEVERQGVTQDIVVGGMFELLTQAKYGKTNGSFDEIYKRTKDHLTNRNA